MEHANRHKSETALLRLMRDTLSRIREYTRGMTENDFKADGKTQSAVIMQLQVLGELAKRIPQSVQADIAIPWKEMAGLRDLVSHDYFGLDLEIIWHTVEESIPDTEAKIAAFLASRANP